MIAFHREKLANELVRALQGEAFLGDAHNGLFLAAPRRTGKSTFLQNDLLPALEANNICVVYVDLWADPHRDPGRLIADAIGRAIQKYANVVSRTAKGAGLTKLNFGGVEVDLGKIGSVDGLTLTDALQLLHEKAKKPVALIIDEAQHALTSDAGEAAMTALKSARDQLNSPGRVNLMLVMSGSDRDKLLRLVNTGSAPFYGSQIQRMPELGTDFIDHVATKVEEQRPELAPVSREKLQQAFALFGCRPQFFMTALGQVLSPLADLNSGFEDALIDAARTQQQQDEAQMESDFVGLSALERAVVWRMLEQGQRYRPYDAEALRFYRERLGRPVSAAQVQRSLEALRQRSPAMVWKSARGEYAVEDAAMHRWFDQRFREGRWPPAADVQS